jgi:peptidoglycan hydrolase-like protein with peptidoglycan-binding domain
MWTTGPPAVIVVQCVSLAPDPMNVTQFTRIGSTGLPVRRTQKRMSLVGFDVGGVDGRYGPKTAAAVKDLQQRSQVTVDGVVGPQTWGIIDALEDEGPVS